MMMMAMISDGGGVLTGNPEQCSSNPCQNNTTCVNGVFSYRCDCPVGYEGTNCQSGSSTTTCRS